MDSSLWETSHAHVGISRRLLTWMHGDGRFFAERTDSWVFIYARCKRSAGDRIIAASLSSVALEVRDQIRNLFQVTGTDDRELS